MGLLPSCAAAHGCRPSRTVNSGCRGSSRPPVRGSGRRAAGLPGRRTAPGSRRASAGRRSDPCGAPSGRAARAPRRPAAAPATCEISGWFGRWSGSSGAEQDLVQLLARAQSGVDDLDVPVGRVGDQRRATSAIRTGSPMSSTSTSPSLPMAPAWMTSCTASCDGHEVAGDVGVGDRDRAARRRSAPRTR